jgi:hypothetical protein
MPIFAPCESVCEGPALAVGDADGEVCFLVEVWLAPPSVGVCGEGKNGALKTTPRIHINARKCGDGTDTNSRDSQ